MISWIFLRFNDSSLLADASSSIFTGSTVPKWLSQAANRGRNVVVLRDSTRTDDHGEEGENGDGIAIPPGKDRMQCLLAMIFMTWQVAEFSASCVEPFL